MDGWVKIGTQLDTKSFDAQITQVKAQMEEIEHKLKQADMGFEVGDTVKLEAQYEKLNSKLGTLVQKQYELTKTDFSKVSHSIEKVGSKVDNVVSKMGKWVMAIFGIRTAYSLVRRAMGIISQHNEQLKTDIEYIGFALASTLEPVIEALIKGVYTLLQYVNYIAMAWFGVNLFAKAGVDNFKGMNKQAKELKKTLDKMSFDEMNIQGDNGSTSALGGVTPSMDLSQVQGETPEWLKWIGENKDKVLGFFTELAIVIATIKIVQFLSQFEWFKNLLKMASDNLKLLFTNFTLMKGLGIGVLLAGVVVLIKGIVDFIKDPSWHNFLTILQGVALIIAGISLLTGGWIVALIALGTAIVLYLIQNWDKVKELLGTVGSWIFTYVIKPVGDFFAGLWNGFLTGAKTAWNNVKSVFSAVGSFFGSVFDTVKNIFKNIGQTIGNVIGNAFKTAINAVLSVVDSVINTPIKAINNLIGVINAVPGINLGYLNTVRIPRLATGGIINYPNKGVSLGGRAIGGESGAEGVIPLTDSQRMETLGQAIGRYITLNLTNINQMNGRTISREIKRITTDNDFVMNS